MRAPFWLKFAVREAHSGARRLGIYMGAITLGVAALVAINSFRAQVVDSVDNEAKALLGADVRLESGRPFSDTVQAVLDSAVTAGVPLARVTTTLSVALTSAGATRLVQLRAVEGPYPFYGEMVSEPAAAWQRLGDGKGALLEASLQQQLDVTVGDSLRLGGSWFEVRGTLTALPPDISFQNAIGPRVFISAAHMPATGLLRFGSLARYQVFLKIADDEELQRFVDHYHDAFRRGAVGIDTAAEQAEDLARALEALGRFLGLVGLGALLLGGLGVASAVNVFVKDKRRTVAVLRCLGASQRTAFSAYLLQATALGTIGALLGAALGVAIQAALPNLIRGLLPIDVPFAIQWRVVGLGLLIGAFVAAAFSLLPLLAVRGISPLRALRHDVDDATRRFDPWRLLAFATIIASVVALAVWQARILRIGLAYSAALVGGLLILWLCAFVLIFLTRRAARGGVAVARSGHTGTGRRRAFAIRQGIANLHRPRNQTTAVVMALGFGVFLLATIWVVQRNLLGWLNIGGEGPQPNLIFFDIQRDQIDDVRTMLARYAEAPPDLVPIVPARVAAVKGVPSDTLLATRRTPRVEHWAVRRDYRHTYRDTLTSTETLVAGEWFDRAPPLPATPDSTGAVRVGRVSIEEDVARNLAVGVGDHITWDVTGVPIESVITSIRKVDWARFETNFFFVFEPGVLEDAPHSLVTLVRISNDTARAAAQTEIVRRHANISVVDLTLVQRSLQRIVDRVGQAVRIMAAFSVAGGALVLFGAIAASRFQRVRESALLRALGATRAQIRNVLLVEYAALGALAALTGVALAAIAGWLLMRFLFEMEFALPVTALLVIWLIVTVSAALLGMLNSREALRDTPIAALREAES